jgi:hypothetical protein
MNSKNPDPPEWFEVSQYDEAINFSFKDWFNQLFARNVMLRILELSDDAQVKWLTTFFNIFKEDPFPELPEMPLYFGHTQEIPLNIDFVKNKALIQNNLWSTTTSETALNFAKLSQNQEAINNITPRDLEVNSSEGAYNPIINKGKVRLIDELEPGEYLGRKSLTVDLNAKETDIKSDFDAWLKAAKKDYEIQSQVQHISEDKMEIWTTSRIIAFFDLKIWGLLNNEPISNEQIMDWIDEGGDYIHRKESKSYRRKLYSRLNKELMNSTFFIRLFRVAYGENIPDGFITLLRDYMAKHNINAADLTENTSQLGEALKNLNLKKD